MEDTITISKEAAEKYGSMVIGTVEQWSLTSGLRFRQEPPPDGVMHYYQSLPVLQQMWAETFSGKHEWRDVPTVEE